MRLWICMLLALPTAGLAQPTPQLKALFAQGEAEVTTGHFLLAERIWNRAIAMSDSLHSDSLVAVALNNRGIVRTETGAFEAALADFNESLKMRKKMKYREGEAITLSNLGRLYYQMFKYEPAGQYLAQSAALTQDAHLKLNIMHTQANIAGSQGRIEEALTIDKQALALCKSSGNLPSQTKFYDNMANCYMFSGRPALATHYFKKCLKIDSAAGNMAFMADTYANLATMEVQSQHWKEAIRYADLSLDLTMQTKAPQAQLKALSLKSDCYSYLGQMDSAYLYLLASATLKDSLRTVKAQSKADEFAAAYGSAIKEAEITKLRQEKQISDLASTKKSLLVQKRNAQLMGFGGLMLLTAVGSSLYYKRQRQLRKQDIANALLRAEITERARMAQDVHDELGSGLSRISLVAGMAGRHLPPDEPLGKDVATISRISAELIDNMRDLIWVLDPENATLHGLVARIREYCSDALESAQQETVFDIATNLPDMFISREAQRSLFLTVKEAVNNCLKHAGDCGMRISIVLEGEALKIELADNGHGFESGQARKGHGLTNMQKRIAALGGQFALHSAPGMGTATTIAMPLASLGRPAQAA